MSNRESKVKSKDSNSNNWASQRLNTDKFSLHEINKQIILMNKLILK